MELISESGLEAEGTAPQGGRPGPQLAGEESAAPGAPGRSALRYWLRLAFGAIVLLVILGRADLTRLQSTLSQVHLGWLALVVLIQILGKLIWSARWAALLKAFQIRKPIGLLMKAIFIGQFFNNFLPSSVGGDLYRGFWVLEEGESYSASLVVIALERFVGLVTMGYVAVPGLILMFASLGGRPDGFTLFLVFLLLLLCTGIILLHPSVFAAFDRLMMRLKITAFVKLRARVQSGLEMLLKSGRLSMRVLGLSVAVQLTGVSFYYVLGQAIGIPLDGWMYLLIVPLVSVATLVPITLNGLGVREGSLILLTQILGVDVPLDQALALGLMASVMIAAVSLIGGGLYIRGKEQSPGTL